MAVPNPSRKRRKYDKARNIATSSNCGTNANMNPDNPCKIAPELKHVFSPIFEAYLPKKGPHIKRARFVIPNTNPYCDGLAPFNSASDG